MARATILPFGIDRVDLKHMLRQIEPDNRDRRKILAKLTHGRRSFIRWVSTTTLLHTSNEDDAGAGAVHTITL
jgi:hypothetical protein